MFLFLKALCRTPEIYAVQATLLLQLLTVVAMAILPAIFYWQYRSRRWWQLGTGLTAFVLTQDYLMRHDKGSIGETFFSAAILFNFFYLPLVAFREGNRHLAQIIAGDAAKLPLHASERLMVFALAVPAHLFSFIVVNALDILDVQLLQSGEDIVKCLFSFTRPVHLQAYRDTLNMLLAAAPVLVLATMLAAWFRRRRGRDLAMP